MHELVQQTSRALSANDADLLESLLGEARRCTSASVENPPELVHAALVLAAQVEAASLHLRIMRAGSNDCTFTRGPWAL